MKEVVCDTCGIKFMRKKSQLLLAKKHYCSIKCFNVSKMKGIFVDCYMCKKRVYKKNNDLRTSESKKYFCSIKCSNTWQGSNRRGENHPNWINGKSIYKLKLIRTDINSECRMCSENNPRVLVVHHVDQNRNNNQLSNLIWLCRNCHFLIHHYAKELLLFNKKI